MILQGVYNLSDDQTEYQINDQISFMPFLDLTLGGNVPAAKTIWLFRDTLTKANVMPDLFALFNQTLEVAHLITHAMSIIDATFVDAPRQRNTYEENQTIKSGNIPEEWAAHKLCQKDTDAHWTKKNNEIHFGYKNHAKVYVDSKLIATYWDDSDAVLYADSAYSGAPISKKLPDNIENRIYQKAYRNHPLNDAQKESNRLKSKVRVRVKHVFGFMTGFIHEFTRRCIGKLRADFQYWIDQPCVQPLPLRSFTQSECRGITAPKFEKFLRFGRFVGLAPLHFEGFIQRNSHVTQYRPKMLLFRDYQQ